MNLNNRSRPLPVFLAIATLLLSFWSSTPRSLAKETAATAGMEVVNVKAFGAKGDGETDDTEAIQAAIVAAQKQRVSIPRSTGGRALYSSPRIYFPAGRYRLSQPLKLDGINNLFGEPYAILEQSNPELDLIESQRAWIMNIEGLTFCGGRTQLNLYNGNLAGGLINILRCNFLSSNGPAVVADIESTNLNVEKSNFFHCVQGMKIKRCDVVAVRDGWFWNSPEMKSQAFIENAGQRTLFENVCANPVVNGFDQRWIDNHATNLTIRNMRFGGEGGGFTPVVNFTKAKPTGLSSIVVEDSWLMNTTNLKRNAAVYLEEIPNMVTIRGNSLTSRELVSLAPHVDESYFKALNVPKTQLAFSASQNIGSFHRPGLPPLLTDPPAADKVAFAPVEQAALAAMIKAAQESWEAARPNTEAPLSASLSDPDLWTTEEPMDGTDISSGEFLTLASGGKDSLLYIWKRDGQYWPHFTLKEQEIDLDQTPVLVFDWLEGPHPAPLSGNLRITIADQGFTIMLTRKGENKTGEHRYNLAERLDLTGKHRVSLQFFPRSWEWIKGRGHDTRKETRRHSRPGEYGIIGNLRFEAKAP